MNLAFWWIAVVAAATAIMLATERLMRRLLPLATLLEMSLIFPHEAPSRFGIALRTGTTRQLERRVERFRESGFIDDPDVPFAEQMLEMVASLSRHDRLTRGHCERVRAYTDLIAAEMQLPEHDVNRLRWAALLHDVGKLAVPAEILNKKGTLTAEEYEVVKIHPDEGMKITEPIAEWLGDWIRAVGEHHERWDGAGYPRGLSGVDIHLGARIVAVADAFDVMTSTRSYKAPVPHHEARAEIARCAGTQFDPAVARAFLNVSIPERRVLMGPLTWLLNLPGIAAPLAPLGSPLASAAGAAGALALGAFVGPTLPTGPTEAAEASPPIAAFAEPDDVQPTTTSTIDPSGDDGATPERDADESPSTTQPSSVPESDEPSPQVPATPPAPPPTNPPPIGLSLVVTDAAGQEDHPISLVFEARANAPATLTTVGTPRHGTVTSPTTADSRIPDAVVTAGTSIYTPDRDFFGTDHVNVRACLPSSCVDRSVAITVQPVNDAPEAADDFATGPEDTPIAIPYFAMTDNDRDPENEDLTVTVENQPYVGSVDTSFAGFTYHPPANWSGTTQLTYRVTDPHGAYDTANVLLTVSSRNDAPYALDDSASTMRNTSVTINARANDGDVDGDPITLHVTGVTAGQASVDHGKIVYTPPSGFIGAARVDYEVRDPSEASAAASVAIDVYGPTILVSRTNDHSAGSPLHGEQLRGWVWIFADPVWDASQVNYVKFFLDGAHVNTQGKPFYDFGKGPQYGLDTSTLAPGAHTITMRTRFRDATTHQANATFTVVP